MTYQTFQPTSKLQPFIGKYWLLNGYLPKEETVTLLPDGSTTLVLNLGEAYHSLNFGLTVQHERTYLVGTATRPDQQVLAGATKLLGIQFWPGGFGHFYDYTHMQHLANRVQEFEKALFPDLHKTLHHFVPYLDSFFLKRLKIPSHSLVNILADIEQLQGQVKATELAKRHFITPRQLERHFQQQVGIPPKTFINLLRFKHALGKIQQKQANQSLADLAWECGYYDHAHLTNEFRQFAGATPTQLILSDFSKSIA